MSVVGSVLFRSDKLIKKFALWFCVVACDKLLKISLRKELYLKLCFYYDNYKKWTSGCGFIITERPACLLNSN